MAQTVSFAILGACILSLTYVPMMSALFLSKKTGHTQNISDRIIGFCYRIYAPLLEGALKMRGGVVEFLQFCGIQVSIKKLENITIPAYKGSIKMDYIVEKSAGLL